MTSAARFYLNELDADGVLIGDIERRPTQSVYTHEAADNYLDPRSDRGGPEVYSQEGGTEITPCGAGAT